MTRLSRESRVWACALLAISLLLCPLAANSGGGVAEGLALRNQNPFLQIFDLPSLQSATLARPGETDFGIALDLAIHADAGDSALETFAIDGESYFVTFSWRRRVSNWLALGIDLPFVSPDEGFLDNTIETWHDTFGMLNTKRRLRRTAWQRCCRFSLGVYASDTHTMFAHDLGVSGFVGGMLLGDGKVLADIQRSAVPFAGVAARWSATERLGPVAQLYAEGAYFDSDLEELGSESIQLAVGLDYRPLRQTLLLKFAVVEDVTANATTDFGLHFAIRSSGG